MESLVRWPATAFLTLILAIDPTINSLPQEEQQPAILKLYQKITGEYLLNDTLEPMTGDTYDISH